MTEVAVAGAVLFALSQGEIQEEGVVNPLIKYCGIGACEASM